MWEVIKTIGVTFITIFSMKMIGGFFTSLLRFGSTFLGQMQAGRELGAINKTKTFFGGAFQDSQGIFIQQISSIKRRAKKDGRSRSDTNVTQARRDGGFVAGGGILKGLGILGAVALVANAFMGITEQSGFLMKALEKVTSFLGNMVTSVADLIDWVAIKVGLMDSKADIKAKERVEARRENVSIRQADILERVSEVTPDNRS